MRRWWMTAILLGAAPSLGAAQESGAGVACSDPRVPGSAREFCATVAQAVESAQPQLGILVAGGNPTLGSASTGGLRLGVLPRVSATAKLNLVFVRLPEILAEQAGNAAERLNQAVGIPAPAVSGTASVGVFPGISVAPTIGGIGSIDLLGTATWLPFEVAGGGGFRDATSDIAYGGGVRVGLLRESFTMPGISASLMYRKLGRVQYGQVCSGTAATSTERGQGYQIAAGACAGGGDPGEFSFDLTDVSGRAVVGKRLLGFGLAAGVGYDRFSSDIGYGFRAPSRSVAGQTNYFARVSDVQLDRDRWSAFANGSFTLLVATLAVEAGWLQGSEPLTDFRRAVSEFDPGEGTFFGSVGLRLAF